MTASTRSKKGAARLRINPIACDGVGMCSHVAPDLIAVDRWGFPIISSEPVTAAYLRQARAAVAACPRRALSFELLADT